jgi:hypothetical protein
MGVGHGINAQGIASRSVKREKHASLFAKLPTEQFLRGGTIFIIAVSQSMVAIHTNDGFQNLRTNA